MSLMISPQKDWRMDLGLCNASALIDHDEIAKVKASCRVSNFCVKSVGMKTGGMSAMLPSSCGFKPEAC
jgi:hypothetical protein